MRPSRRDVLRTLIVLPAAAALTTRPLLRAMMAPPSLGPKNLILLDLRGGNDGLNTVVPFGVNGGAYASVFRQGLALPMAKILPITAEIGLHSGLQPLLSHWNAGRLAIVQGVGYPSPSFSHEVASKIWQTGDPTEAALDGWLARHLATQSVPASPDAVCMSGTLEQLLSGSGSFVPAFESLDQFVFPYDGWHWDDKDNRQAAYTAMAAGLVANGGGGNSNAGSLASMAGTSEGVLGLIDLFAGVPEYVPVGSYPDSYLSDSLKLVAKLLHANIGMRYFHLLYGGFDTHADQEKDDYHTQKLGNIAQGLAALHDDLVALGIAGDTVIVVFSEFGRTVYENGSDGTDHGTVGPVLVFGTPVAGGLVGSHPPLDPGQLTENGELALSVDYRDVFGTLVDGWLEGDAAAVFPGHSLTTLPLLV